MVEGGKGSVFPVIFFDGKREINIGNIRIQPTIVFKPFQLMLSERIGISPNQISIYLCDRKGSSKFEDRRKIPVTGKANFALISREKDCFFLVVMKRSRKARNRKVKPNGVDIGEFFKKNVFSQHLSSSENLILLRRNQPEINQLYDRITQTELASMNERVQNLQLQRENFDLVMQKSNPNLMHLNSPNSFPRIQDTFPTKKSLCHECANTSSNGRETSTFHHCNNDAVLVGSFRSRSGPVNRPAKQIP